MYTDAAREQLTELLQQQAATERDMKHTETAWLEATEQLERLHGPTTATKLE